MRVERIFEKGDIVIYENRKCRIKSITEKRVELINLEKKHENDWSMLTVEIKNAESDYNDFFTKYDDAEDLMSKIRISDDTK